MSKNSVTAKGTAAASSSSAPATFGHLSGPTTHKQKLASTNVSKNNKSMPSNDLVIKIPVSAAVMATKAEMELDNPINAPVQNVCAQCTAWARVGSKYCSHACGIAANFERIQVEKAAEIEKARRQQFERRCAVIWTEILKSISTNSFMYSMEADDAKLLEEIEEDRKHALAMVELIRTEQEALESDIQRYQVPLGEDESPEEKEKVGGVKSGYFDCPYCGVAPSSGNVQLSHHLPNCFLKYEQTNPLLGKHPTPEGDVTSLIYCDRMDPKTGMYCKKLKASCWQHSGVVAPKPMPGTKSKASAEQMKYCGAPTAESPTGRCRLSKKSCSRHFNWENLARQQLELQLISHAQLAEALQQELAAIKEKMILARLSRGLGANAITIPGPAADTTSTLSSAMDVS